MNLSILTTPAEPLANGCFHRAATFPAIAKALGCHKAVAVGPCLLKNIIVFINKAEDISFLQSQFNFIEIII